MSTRENVSGSQIKLQVEKSRAQAAKSNCAPAAWKRRRFSSRPPLVAAANQWLRAVADHYPRKAFSRNRDSAGSKSLPHNSQMHLLIWMCTKRTSAVLRWQEVDFALDEPIEQGHQRKMISASTNHSPMKAKDVAVHAKKINQESAKGLISGMYVSANIKYRNSTLPALPKDAVVRNGDGVFVLSLRKIMLKRNRPNEEQHKDEGKEKRRKIIKKFISKR